MIGSRSAPASARWKTRGGDRRGSRLPPDQARLLEVAQSVREQVGGDAREPVAEIRVPARALGQQLADDQQGPAITHDVEQALATEQYCP